MKPLHNQNGYSLLISLLLIMLFAILGAGLMAMTFNGTARNETREHLTQSQDLATKGLQKIESQIQAELVGEMPSTGYTNTQFEQHFKRVTDRYLCSANKSIALTDQRGDGTAKMCISSIRPSPNYPDSKTMKELRLQSIGNKGGHDATVYKTVEMGAEDIEKVLNYTVSTLGQNADGGNLYLHGSSDITGDLNIPGNVFSTDLGYAYIGGDRWANSTLSRSLPIPVSVTESRKSVLNLRGRMYTFRSNPFSYQTHISSGFSGSHYREITNAFDPAYQPVLQRNVEEIEPIDFTKEFRVNKDGAVRGSSTYSSSGTYNSLLTHPNNVTITGNTNLTFNRNAFFSGNLTIGSSRDGNNYRNIKIDAKRMYVDGNVVINNVNLQANFTLYVKGNVTIRDVTISGIKERNLERGSIIVFSNGDFQLSNISEYQDTPSTITGFFYSSGTMQLYGFGSNTTIIGGVAGENVVLNAMRGRAKESVADWPNSSGETTEQQCRLALWSPGPEWYRSGLLQWCRDVTVIVTSPIPYQTVSTNLYDTAANQAKLPSRLQIIYNEELLNVYRNTIDYTSSVIFPENVITPVEIELDYGN